MYIFYSMPKKETLDLLRQKVHNLRANIVQMERQVRGRSKDSTASRHSRSVSRGSSIHNPNRVFNVTQPVGLALKAARQKLLLETKQTPHRRKELNMTQSKMSPNMRGLTGEIDNQYYHAAEGSRVSSESRCSSHSPANFVPHRFQYADHGKTRNSPSRDGKRKTFSVKKTDLIVNPEGSEMRGRKIVKQIQRSPERMLTENPRSNPRVYFNKEQMIMLQGRGGKGQRNKETFTQPVRSGPIATEKTFRKNMGLGERRHYADRPAAPQPQKHRRHYSKHIIENLNSSLGW